MTPRIILLLFFTLSWYASRATHIVGGVVTYKYLGNSKYELKFKIYRDCYSQSPFDGEPFGGQNSSPFYYAIYANNSGNPVFNGGLDYIKKGKVSSVITNECLDTNQSCVEEATYIDTFTAPDPNTSYTIIHQRCCRNNGINNIQPLPSGNMPGMTIYTVIPSTSLYGNNSAVFNNFPPLFLCQGQQFNFDHSATDADGDILKYYLVTPLSGGTPNSPVVQTPSTSKIQASWQPPYSLSNIVGGTPNIAIDETTGLLTCKPDVVGRYVVSVMVKEFRGTVCIDSSIRDFQFNVNQCDIPKSDLPFIPGTYDLKTNIADYKVNCTDKKIDFVNSSTNASRFLWNFGDPASGINDTSTLANPSHIYTDTGVYILTLVSYKTRADSKICNDTLRRRVRIYPVFHTNFAYSLNPVACKGVAINFNDATYTTYGSTNKWTWDFGDGSATQSTKNTTHSFNSSGTFNVKLSSESSLRCIDDTTISVTVYESPQIANNIPNACIGQQMNLQCSISVASPSSIVGQRWTLPTRTDNNCNTVYTPTSMSPFTISLWTVTDKGCKDSQAFNVIVNPLPRIDAINDTSICYDSKVQLYTNGGISYLWNSNPELDNINISNPTASPTYPNPSKYIVKGTDAKGCYNYDSVIVSFLSKPFISAGLDTNVCLNPSPFKIRDSVILNGQGTFSSVYWTPTTGLDNPNTRRPHAKPKQNTDYIFHGIDANGCIVKDTVRVIVLDPNFDLIPSRDTMKCLADTIVIEPLDQGTISKYTWSPTRWVSNPNKRNPAFTTRDTTLYILYVENYCYNKYDSIRVDVIPNPDIRMLDVDSTCHGNIYQFNLNPVYSYTWSSPDPTLSSTTIHNPTANPGFTVRYYYVTAVDNFGCKNTDSMELIVNYPPNVTILGRPRFLCEGDSVQISIFTNLRTWIKWWDKAHVSNDTSKTVYLFPPTTEKFFVRAYTAGNCYTTDSFILPVQKPIQPVVQSPVHVCKGRFTSLYGSGGFYYLWTPPYNINDTLVDKPQVFPDSTFTYKVKISNDCFHSDDSVLVIVDSLPKVFATQDTAIYRGAEIELEAISQAFDFEWSPESKINSNALSKKIRVSPEDTTLFKVRVRDANLCEGWDSTWVYVFSKNVLLLPSAFSPNGDGINDVFRVVKYLNVRKLGYFEVFNRWGQKVFSTQDITKGWDGMFNGELSPSGSYTWEIEITNHDNEKISKSGSVELIR